MKVLGNIFLIFLFFNSCQNEPQNGNAIEYREPEVGEAIDEHKGIQIYYNGEVLKSHGRTIIDGYNCGKKYQCVEFIKRYYYLKLKHKMTNVWGHASQYFNDKVKDGAFNRDKGLKQYVNPSISKPQIDDIIIWGGQYGHVALVTKVEKEFLEVVQQNVGTSTRMKIGLIKEDNKYKLNDPAIVGWLRK